MVYLRFHAVFDFHKSIAERTTLSYIESIPQFNPSLLSLFSSFRSFFSPLFVVLFNFDFLRFFVFDLRVVNFQ